MNAPDVAIEPHPFQLPKNLTTPAATADHGNRPRTQQTRQVTLHHNSLHLLAPNILAEGTKTQAPSARNRSRLMI